MAPLGYGQQAGASLASQQQPSSQSQYSQGLPQQRQIMLTPPLVDARSQASAQDSPRPGSCSTKLASSPRNSTSLAISASSSQDLPPEPHHGNIGRIGQVELDLRRQAKRWAPSRISHGSDSGIRPMKASANSCPGAAHALSVGTSRFSYMWGPGCWFRTVRTAPRDAGVASSPPVTPVREAAGSQARARPACRCSDCEARTGAS
jgi:hypothetical protein